MRRAITFGLLLAACGSSNDDNGAGGSQTVCSHPVVATWQGVTQNDQITISADKTFQYSGVDGCSSTGTFTCPGGTTTQGTIQVSISSSSGGGCLPAGNYTCAFQINANAMAYNCGAGALQYRRP